MDDEKRRAKETYNAAAEFFDEPALGFWDRFGRATVDRLELRPGAIVLDACAGSGASALAAAERVGPSGKVVAVDLADNLLALARAKASVSVLETSRPATETSKPSTTRRPRSMPSSSCSVCSSSPTWPPDGRAVAAGESRRPAGGDDLGPPSMGTGELGVLGCGGPGTS